MSARKYHLNFSIVEQWTPALAYLVGYVLSDGNVNKGLTRVSFVSADREHLELVRDLFEADCPIRIHHAPETDPLSERQCYCLNIDSRTIASAFNLFGIQPNKSRDGGYPIIPVTVWWHFFRGILDGDGNIYFSRKHGLRLTIAGNQNTVVGLQTDLLNGLTSSLMLSTLAKITSSCYFCTGRTRNAL